MPHQYLKIIASLLPKEIEIGHSRSLVEMTDDELMAVANSSTPHH